MLVPVKKLHPNAVIPKYAKHGDAGLDLTAISINEDTSDQIVYGTGLAIQIPYGYVGLLFPRSSICNKTIHLSNSVGMLDSGYRGEIKFVFNHRAYTWEKRNLYQVGDRIGQLLIIPYPHIELIETNDLLPSERGVGAFGSTGQ